MTPTGSKRKAAKSPRFVGHDDSPLAPLDLLAPPDLAPSMAAAHYAAEHGCSFADAGVRYGVTKQAVADAFRRAYSIGPRKVGRPPSGRLPRTHSISVPGLTTVRCDAVELAVWQAAAGKAGLSLTAWMRSLWTAAAPPGVPRAAFLRAHARRATGMPDES